MNNDHKWGRARSAHGPDDEESYTRRSRQRQHDNRLGQLCRQVERVVSLSLSGECHDDVLSELCVHSVVPAPDAGRLLVLVYFPNPAMTIPLPELLMRLDRVHGWLRGEVTRALVRKRAPELAFQLVGKEVMNDGW